MMSIYVVDEKLCHLLCCRGFVTWNRDGLLGESVHYYEGCVIASFIARERSEVHGNVLPWVVWDWEWLQKPWSLVPGILGPATLHTVPNISVHILPPTLPIVSPRHSPSCLVSARMCGRGLSVDF